MNTKMKKTFNFGKIDYYHPGIKNNPVEVEIELRTTKNNEIEFTACGDIWNHMHTRTYSSGQNLDKIALFDYKKDCDYLESIGLNPDTYNGKPYYYGQAWISRTIPDADLARINKLLEVN